MNLILKCSLIFLVSLPCFVFCVETFVSPELIPLTRVKRNKDMIYCTRGHTQCLGKSREPNMTGDIEEVMESDCRLSLDYHNCMQQWSSSCTEGEEREKAVSFYNDFLKGKRKMCRNLEGHNRFSKHGDCYTQSLTHLNICMEQLRVDLTRPHNDMLKPKPFCCLQLEYLNCMYNTASRFCSDEGRRLILKQGDMHMSVFRRRRSKDHCASDHYDSNVCPDVPRNIVDNVLNKAVIFHLSSSSLIFLIILGLFAK